MDKLDYTIASAGEALTKSLEYLAAANSPGFRGDPGDRLNLIFSSIALAEKATSLDPMNADAYQVLYHNYSSLGLAREKIYTLERLVILNSGDKLLISNLVTDLIEQKDWDKARKFNDMIMEQDPSLDTPHYAKILILDGLGDTKSAIDEYELLLKKAKDKPKALRRYAAFLLDKKHFREGIALIRKALEAEPENPYHFNYLGLFYEKSGKLQDALENYRTAAELNDSCDDGRKDLYLYNLGSILIMIAQEKEPGPERDEDLGEAKNLLLEVIRNKPDDFEAHSALSCVYAYLGDLDNAVKQSGIAANMMPGNPLPLRNLVRYLSEKKEYQQALDIAEQLIRLNPLDYQSYGHTSEIYKNLGDFRSAEDYSLMSNYIMILRVLLDASEAEGVSAELLLETEEWNVPLFAPLPTN